MSLPFGPEIMLQRVIRLLGEVVEPLVVVGAAGQQLPELPRGVQVLHDRQKDRGPLEGIANGLRAVADRAPAAFVAACDVPLLQPAFVHFMVECLGAHDIAVPTVDGIDHPLTAVYRTRVLPQIEELLDANRRRPVFLFDQVPTRRVSADEIRNVDPLLHSLQNVNTPAEYEAALSAAGIHPDSPSEDTIEGS